MFTKDLAMLSYIKKKNRSVHVISSQQNDDTICPDIQNKPYIRFYIIMQLRVALTMPKSLESIRVAEELTAR